MSLPPSFRLAGRDEDGDRLLLCIRPCFQERMPPLRKGASLFSPPPPTDQLDHARDLKFGMDDRWDITLGAIEAIFDMSPPS